MKILTAAQVREVDRLSTEQYGIPSLLLMENAGMRVVESMEERFDFDGASIAILCGKGNNGGDGFVIARQLLQRGYAPRVFLFGRETEVRGDARVNLDILKALGRPPVSIADEAAWNDAKARLRDADIVVDALLGTGLNKPVDGLLALVIESINRESPRASIVAVDVPSGLPADGAFPIGPAVAADLTVTFTALKPALVLAPNCERAGEVVVAEIGNPAPLLDGASWNLISPSMFGGARAPRERGTHKGSYGRVLAIAGSRGKSGAAALAGRAALRVGAGLVTVAAPASVLGAIASSMPELMTEPLEETPEGAAAIQGIGALVEDKTVLAIGPGMGTHSETQQFIRTIVREAAVPVVVDADGLNAFEAHIGELCGEPSRPVVVTPHPGEMARLIGRDTAFIAADRAGVASDLARRNNLYVILKGYRTIVAAPDGAVYVNPTGNPGMATGGSGDILTGMLAGILAQPFGSLVERLCLAVYLHGLAGDLAAAELGEESLVATDLLRFLPQAWKEIRK